ncbi:MAG: hypothetical protein ACKV2U_01450 [Bryobacteraceae bacterium]
MTYNKFLRLLWLTGATLFPNVAFAQTVVPPEEQPVSGSCVVTLGVAANRREACDLSTGTKEVPAGFRLIVEHVSAACSTTPNRGIYTLALLTKSSREDRGRMAHIPVRLQAGAWDQLRYTGAEMVRMYAGSETKLELLVSTTESAPAGHTSCDVTFSGVMKRINQ